MEEKQRSTASLQGINWLIAPWFEYVLDGSNYPYKLWRYLIANTENIFWCWQYIDNQIAIGDAIIWHFYYKVHDDFLSSPDYF